MTRAVSTALTRTFWIIACVVVLTGGLSSILRAAEGDALKTIVGTVQNQDLRRVPQALVEVKNQEGETVAAGLSNDAGEFSIPIPSGGTYSVSAVQETYRSEYVVFILGADPP